MSYAIGKHAKEHTVSKVGNNCYNKVCDVSVVHTVSVHRG